MSDEATPARGRLREHVAEEIRALLARRKMSATQLARLTGLKQSSPSRRMTGETAFDMDDLELIANALGISVTDLMPRRVGASADPKRVSDEQLQGFARRGQAPIDAVYAAAGAAHIARTMPVLGPVV